ncbi:MAG: DUF1501 domain-containing protein [Pseudomonadota bacterium]
MLNRRLFLGAGCLGTLAFAMPFRISFAQTAATNKRFIFIIQRGAADGLSMIAPLADPALTQLRGPLLENAASGMQLDKLFHLHPAMAEIGKLYQSSHALFAHAIASNYRNQSHFDGQNILESGGTFAYAEKTGWLNRLTSQLSPNQNKSLAIAQVIPMAMRGAAPISNYAPAQIPVASEDLLKRVSQMYQQDKLLNASWNGALKKRELIDDVQGESGKVMGELACRLMTPDDGTRIMMIETGGWDTHSAQTQRLNVQLKNLDQLIFSIKNGLGNIWNNTLVIVATEFGRTVAINNTGGTDHGTASSAMLFGGGMIRGGRVIADWPGLNPEQLLNKRDLKPTLSLESLIVSSLAEHYQMDPQQLAKGLYPGLKDLKLMEAVLG